MGKSVTLLSLVSYGGISTEPNLTEILRIAYDGPEFVQSDPLSRVTKTLPTKRLKGGLPDRFFTEVRTKQPVRKIAMVAKSIGNQTWIRCRNANLIAELLYQSGGFLPGR